MRQADRPAWLDAMRDALARYGRALLVYTEKGPEPRKYVHDETSHMIVGAYTQRASDQQLLEDVAQARIDAAIRGRGRPRGT